MVTAAQAYWLNRKRRQKRAASEGVGVPAWVLSGAALDLNFAEALGYNSWDVAKLTPDSILTYTAPSPKMVYGGDGVLRYAPHNLALNTKLFSGGSVPTGWTQLAADGSRTLVDSIYWTGHQAIRFVASAQRPGLQSGAVGTIPAGRAGEISFTVEAIDTMPGAWQDIIFGSNSLSVVGVYVNGVFVSGSVSGAPSIVPGDRVAYRFNATADNRMRFGLGCAGNASGDITLSAPMLRLLPSPHEDYLENSSTSAARYSLPIDHDPITFDPLGVLIEEQRTSLLTYSEQFDNALWPKNSATIVANAAVAPDGTTTADLIYPTTTGSNRRILRGTGGVTTGLTVYTQSVYVKSAGFQWVHFNATAAATGADSVWFDIINGVVGTVGANATATSITDVGDGWFRISVSGPASTTSGNNYFYLAPTDADNSYTATTNGTDGLYIWGAQLEAGAFPTSYIPTVASQVTRAADQVSILTSAFGYNAAESTMVAEYRAPSLAFSQDIVWIADGLAESLGLYTLPNNAVILWTRDGGVTQTTPTIGTMTGTTNKAAAAWKLNDFAGSLNGAAVTMSMSDDTGTMPTPTELKLNPRAIASALGNIHIKRLTYFPTRRTNADLQGLTT